MTCNLQNLTVLPSPAGIKVIHSQEQTLLRRQDSSRHGFLGDHDEDSATTDDNNYSHHSASSEMDVANNNQKKDVYLVWNELHHQDRVLTYVSSWKEAETSLYHGRWVDAASKPPHEYWGI